MNKTITPTKNESGLPLVAVHDVKGWCEYEPSYDGVVTHINTACARLFGFNSPDDVIGKKINELYAHPFDHEKTLSMLFRDGHVHGFYTLMKSRNGNLFFIKQTSTLITEGIDISPLKVKNEFEPVHPTFTT